MNKQQLRPFNQARLKDLQKIRGNYDPYQNFWDELEIVLRCKHPKSNEWEQMKVNNVVLGEVWIQNIGEIYYTHTVHKFSYLYVGTEGLAIDIHGHYEPANGGRQIRKITEWYVFPDGAIYHCGKDDTHMLFNKYNHPIYVLSIKVCSNGTR